MKTNNVAKLFGVLVLGGSMIAGANDTVDPVVTPEPHCQVKLVVEKELLNEETTCLDGKSDEEVLEIVAEAKKPVEPVEPDPICTIWGF